MASNGKEPEVMEGEIIEPTAIMPREPERDLALTPVFDLKQAQERLAELEKFVKMYLHEGEDYGTIPGTPKPTLFKPGADKLCDIYGLADKYRITSRTEDWERNIFKYEVECQLVSKRNNTILHSTGMGSCNSYEGKYRWREAKRKCPTCNKEAIIKGQEQYGGGWVCWKKQDGCGEKFPDGDTRVESQSAGKVENEDIPTLDNTILKMAKKRAKVDAVLSATRSSGLFTQDIEDIHKIEAHEEGSADAAQAVAARKIQEQINKVEDYVKSQNKTPAHPKMNLPAVNQPSQIEKVLKESIKKAEERDTYAVSGMLLKAERKQGPKSKYMAIVVEQPGKKQVKLSMHPHIFHDAEKTELFSLMEMASGRFVSFLVKPETNPKFNPWVARVLKIASLEFGEDGEPVRMRKEPEPLPIQTAEELEEYSL